MIEIEEADNGWIVRYNNNVEVIQVIEYDEFEEEFSENHAEAVKELLNTIMSGLELYNSKHNKYRVNIEVKKQ